VSIAASKSMRAALGSAPAEASTRKEARIEASRLQEADFCRHLEMLSAWKRRNLRILDMPQGGDVLVWLLKDRTRARPLKDLYRGSRFSEPTIRWVLKALVDDGFIAIERNPDDLRVRTVHLTPKLMAAMHEYLDLLRECALHIQQPAEACCESEHRAAAD
jgi:hypothetical protein